MPVHLLPSGSGQAVIALLVIVFSAICVRYWRAVLAVVAALLIGAALITFVVILDLRIVHEIAGYVGHFLW